MQTVAKLPKFVLQKLDGDIMKWKQFEYFKAAVHKNERIPNTAKFTYLIGDLE